MNYLPQIIKGFRTKRGLSLINLLGLSICSAGALLILLFVQFELSYDNFHEKDNIYRVESRLYDKEVLTDSWATTTSGHALAMVKEIPGIENSVRLTAQDKEQVFAYGTRMFKERRYCFTEPSFFEIFNYPLIHGKKNQLSRPQTMVISRSTAKRYFDDVDPIGKVITYKTPNFEQNFEITGVMEDMPANSNLKYDILLSFNSLPEYMQTAWFIHGVYTYIKLQPNKQPTDIENAFASIAGKYITSAIQSRSWKVELLPLKEIHLTPQKPYEKEPKGNRLATYILLAMAIALLIIGWINSLNLNIAKYLEKGKEIGIKKSFGVSRQQIVLQGIMETLLVNLLAITISIGLLELLLPTVHSWVGQEFGSQFILRSSFWIIVAAIIVGSTLISGIYPSIISFKVKPTDIMRGKVIYSFKGQKIRKILIILQFVASFILISGTLVVVKQVYYMQKQTNGIALDRIMVLKHPSYTDSLKYRIENFKNRLKQNSQIEDVTISGAIPGIEVANYFENRKEGSDISENKLVQMFPVDVDYLNTYGLIPTCGRNFSKNYGDEINNIILNEEAVKRLGFSSNAAAIGQRLSMEVLKEPLVVVGVVKNYHQQSLAIPYKPIIFFIKERVPFIPTPFISIRFSENGAKSMLPVIEETFKEFFPNSLFSHMYLDSFYQNQYQEDRNFGWIFASSAILTVVVACIGLWVVILFSTLSKLKSIGVRKVLGANQFELAWELSKELLLLTTIAALIGTPIGFIIMDRWLEEYAFHIPLPYGVFAVSYLLLIAVATVTVIYQLWKAINIKPMKILKNE